MAKQYGKNSAVDFAAANLMSFGKSFSRLNGQPLDKSEIWYNDFAALEAYALTDAAYVGQKVVYIDTTAGTVTHYSIEIDGTLKPLGDTESIMEYIGELPEGTDAKTVIEYINKKTEGIATDAALGELQSAVDALELAVGDAESGLVKDVDALEATVGGTESGLVKDVADLKTKVGESAVGDQIDAKITALDLGNTYEAKGAAATAKGEIEDVIGEVAEGKTVVDMIADAQTAATYNDTEVRGLIKDNADAIDAIEADYLKADDKEALQDAIDLKANSADVYTKTEADSAIQTAADAAEESAVDRVLGYLAEEEVNASYDTLKEVAAWIESDTTASAELVTRISNIEKDYLKGADKTALEGEIDALGEFVGDLPEGAASDTVVAYIQEVVDALKIGDYAKVADLTTLSGKVTAAEGNITTLQGLVGDTAVATQIASATANKVDKVAGSRLMTDAEGAKLEGIEEGAQANKIETVSAEFGLTNEHLTIAAIEQSKVTGLVDALDGKVDKVSGSRLMTQSEADKLEKLVMGDDGSVSISGTVAAGNVSGLGEWITARAGSLEGLSENNLTDAMVTKLGGIAEGAQVNVIDGVSNEFVISADGKVLSIQAIEQSKVTGLSDALAGKVDAVEGMGLSHNDLTDELVAKINAAEANYIKSVSDEFTVDADGKLSVGAINVNSLVQDENSYLIMNGGSATV